MQQKSILNLRSEQGGLLIQDTDAHTGSWANFVVIQDAVIANIVMPKEEGDVAGYYGITYPQGFVFDGPIDSITLASGKVRMYNYVDPSKNAAAKTIQGA